MDEANRDQAWCRREEEVVATIGKIQVEHARLADDGMADPTATLVRDANTTRRILLIYNVLWRRWQGDESDLPAQDAV
jgi:hypothetical protein